MFEADYVLGTDGRNSSVRRTMCIPFEGVTFSDFKMITADICYDFAKEMGYNPLKFFIHPNEWGVVGYTGQNGDGTEKGADVPQWRVAFVEHTDLPTSKEEIYARARVRMGAFMKGGKDFEIVRAESYWMHQHCAAQARKRRIMLAGDALHVSLRM